MSRIDIENLTNKEASHLACAKRLRKSLTFKVQGQLRVNLLSQLAGSWELVFSRPRLSIRICRESQV